VLQRVLEAPFGPFLLGVLALGLVGYALWRFVQAALDPERKGNDLSGLFTRGAYVLSAVVYSALAFYALRLMRGSGTGGDGDRTYQDLTALALALPVGAWLVGAAGLCMTGSGGFQLYRAFTAKFRDKLATDRMSAAEVTWAMRVGRLGFAARGIVFGIIGVFLLQAAVQAQPGEARGTGGASPCSRNRPSARGSWASSRSG
jgi:hypothetical protein